MNLYLSYEQELEYNWFGFDDVLTTSPCNTYLTYKREFLNPDFGVVSLGTPEIATNLIFTWTGSRRAPLDQFTYTYRLTGSATNLGSFAYNVTYLYLTLFCKYDLVEHFQRINNTVPLGTFTSGGSSLILKQNEIVTWNYDLCQPQFLIEGLTGYLGRYKMLSM